MVILASRNLVAAVALVAPLGLAMSGCTPNEPPVQSSVAPGDFASSCTPEAMTAVTTSLGMGVTIKQVPNGPQLPGGTRLVPSSGNVPAYCQVTGSYVTNPKTGKTANFIATLPANWNGKYLQLGCSGSCGYLLMNDPASPPITITAQGYPKQLIEKGYAIFGNDLGHLASSPASMDGSWMTKADGSLDDDAIEDYLVRADLVMADMGKAYTRAFYARRPGSAANISRSYFSGCSQGGREALMAATRFPDKFDGIIAGSPASDIEGIMWHGLARALFAQDVSPAKLTPGQVEMLKSRVLDQCDSADGVKDGLIQNPAACNIHPSGDFPICKEGQSGDSCISSAQAQSISVYLAGMTSSAGALVQPGYPISDQTFGFVGPVPAGISPDRDIRSLIGREFDGKRLFTASSGATQSGIDAFHVTTNDAAFAKFANIMRKGSVKAEDFSKFMNNRAKLLWYHNLSDEMLSPFMSINRYKTLAQTYGGYAKLQQNIRFFAVPDSGHCGMGGPGPSNFDAIGTLEAWVEHGSAPNSILARSLDPAKENILMGNLDWSRPAPRTMPLCAFPEMASFKGSGDVKDAANWECRSSDSRMLQVGTTGRQAGVLK